MPSSNSQAPDDKTPPGFLSASDKETAAKQRSDLTAINAPNYLCSAAIDHAKQNPRDDRVPEALYRYLTAVHLGCLNDAGTGYAKTAFKLLHRRYADSDWADKGRSWYKANGCNRL
jgi:hypothetical protein